MPETLKIILAVMGIFILAYLVFSFYGLFVKSTNLEQAEATLNEIFWEFDYMEKNNKLEGKVMLYSPQGWMVVSFPNEDKKVLCVCPEKEENEKIYASCSEEGVCENFPQPINIVTVDLDDYSVSLKNVPREIFIQKEENGFRIYTMQKQVEHQITFKNFLNAEIEVEGEKKKIYEQMIAIVEGNSKKWIEEINPPILSEFNELFGKSGWAMRYSKEGKSYPWKYVDGNPERSVWDIAKLGEEGNVAIALEEKINYNNDNGVLKVQFRALKG